MPPAAIQAAMSNTDAERSRAVFQPRKSLALLSEGFTLLRAAKKSRWQHNAAVMKFTWTIM